MPTIPWTTARTGAAVPSPPSHAPVPSEPAGRAPASHDRASRRSANPTTNGPSNSTTNAVASAGAQVMASRFILTSARHTVTMLRTALAVRRAVLANPGALGVSLAAHPLRREYWTLSAWSDRAALYAFVTHPVHREAMRRLGPVMSDAHFTFWTVPAGTDVDVPTWAQARKRITESIQRDL